MQLPYTNVQQMRLVSVLQNNVLTLTNIIKSSTRGYVLPKQHYLQISMQKKTATKNTRKNTPIDSSYDYNKKIHNCPKYTCTLVHYTENNSKRKITYKFQH